MQVFRGFEQDEIALVGWGLRVKYLSADGTAAGNAATHRLAGMGCSVELGEGLTATMDSLARDPLGFGLFVMDCDGLGGLDAGRRAVALMGDLAERLPTLLISSECRKQEFPSERHAPIELRKPLSSVALRVALEHATRDRVMWKAA